MQWRFGYVFKEILIPLTSQVWIGSRQKKKKSGILKSLSIMVILVMLGLAVENSACGSEILVLT